MVVPELIEGGCQCGAVRYRIVGQVFELNVCHCNDCQRQSGSAFGMSLVVASDAVQLTRGEVQTFVKKTEDGRDKLGAFCATCGVRIYNATDRLMSVKAGTLDDRSWLRPDGHYWVSRQQNWLQFETAEVKS